MVHLLNFFKHVLELLAILASPRVNIPRQSRGL
jgi:hypothetical protein